MTLLITGCALIKGDDSLWGDLFLEGDCWVFVGAVWPNGEPIWQRDRPVPVHIKCLFLQDGVVPFESRGVFIIPKVFAALNLEARNYLIPGRAE